MKKNRHPARDQALCAVAIAAALIFSGHNFAQGERDRRLPHGMFPPVSLPPIATYGPPDVNAIATVRYQRGAVQFSEDQYRWHSLKDGQRVTPWTSVRTGPDSETVLFLDHDGAFLHITENRQILLYQFLGMPTNFPTGFASAESAHRGAAVVRAIRGGAEYSEDGLAWRPLRVNAALAKGTAVRTRPGAKADLFVSGLLVRVAPESMVKLEDQDLTQPGEAQAGQSLLVLIRGTILTNAKQPGPTSRYGFRPAQLLYRKGEERRNGY